jgi:hypothetical protein
MTDDELDQRVREAILAEPVDIAPLERSIRQRIEKPREWRWAIAVAASIAIVIVGGLAYRAFSRPQPPPLCVAAAQDHRREIVNGEPRPWLTKLPEIEALAEKQGVPGSAVAALDTTGYRLERARLCFLKKQIFLHLVYTKNGQELSVYLRPRGSESPFDGAVREVSVGPEDLAYFQTERVTAVFVDERSKARVAIFARAGLHSFIAMAL